MLLPGFSSLIPVVQDFDQENNCGQDHPEQPGDEDQEEGFHAELVLGIIVVGEDRLVEGLLQIERVPGVVIDQVPSSHLGKNLIDILGEG